MAPQQGEWTTTTAGGCPKHPSWTVNPQFQIVPTVEGASYTLLLQQHVPAPYHAIGFWLMQADNGTDRKVTLSKSQMVTKTKYKAAGKVSHTVQLPLRQGGLPYIVVVSTFDPQQLGRFTLTLSSAEDPAATLVPLQPEATAAAAAAAPLAPLRPAPATATATATAPAAPAAPATVAAPKRAPPARQASTAATAATSAAAAAPSMLQFQPAAASLAGEPSNEPTFVAEGQGLSSLQERDAATLVAAAEAQVASSGRPFEDADFPPSATSLGAGWAHAPLATQWRRPVEIAGDGAKLFKNDWEIEGVVLGPAQNGWLMAALNILAGDREVLERVFVDARHGASGFYLLRFFHDDPRSDDDWKVDPDPDLGPDPNPDPNPNPNPDDWKVVLVDDRLPCGADGRPCYSHNPSADVFWAAIVEKGLAKLFGSYAATEAPPTPQSQLQALELRSNPDPNPLNPSPSPNSSPQPTPNPPPQALELLSGGSGQDALAVQGQDPGALFQAVMQAFGAKCVVGARIDAAQPEAGAAVEMGLVAGRPYCIVTGGDMMGAGKMLRLRGFTADPEWRGKWADGDAAWTNQLRQLLAYKKDEVCSTGERERERRGKEGRGREWVGEERQRGREGEGEGERSKPTPTTTPTHPRHPPNPDP